MATNVKYRSMTFGFYISGQEDQQIKINTAEYFEKARDHYANVLLAQAEPWIESVDDGREFKLTPISKDNVTGVYRGIISKKRIDTLPYIGRRNDHSERKIDIKDDEDMWERSYFMYYPTEDILVFQENLLGPKASDLEYVLFKRCAELKKGFTFESIWRSNALKNLLNGKSTFKKVELSIALPRNFDVKSFEIDDKWTEQMLDLMNNTGMSKLNLVFFGRATQRRGQLSYIKESVGESIKKMIEGFGAAKNTPKLRKAKLTTSGNNKEEVNLLDEKIRAKIRLACNNGYEDESDVFNKMDIAKRQNEAELKAYRANAA
ncbi:TPA: hypothetical protein JAJ28_000536 [Aeromonas hydrophila]|uniref:Uncharacterized protein n=1 Tax=Aeromonas hydrophila TaxID=644 RepID=A0AAD3YI98_AERHY|nr:hypothetical protein [Aeromonas hydrophila]